MRASLISPYPGRAGLAGPRARSRMGPVKVLLVEDNKRMARYLRQALADEGYAVETLHDGDEGLARAKEGDFDVIVLDLMLPGRSGLEIVSELRRSRQTPVLMISARGETESRVEGLDRGADDYLPKPFSLEEFLARIRAMRRRATAQTPTQLACGDLALDLVTHKVTRKGQKIVLTNREFALLEHLVRHQGKTLSKTSIAEQVWGYRFDWESNIIEVFINQLRNKIDRDFEPKLIHTVRGVGYKISAHD